MVVASDIFYPNPPGPGREGEDIESDDKYKYRELYPNESAVDEAECNPSE